MIEERTLNIGTRIRAGADCAGCKHGHRVGTAAQNQNPIPVVTLCQKPGTCYWNRGRDAVR